MQINLISIGTRMPAWVNTAFNDYAKRLPREFSLQLVEIAAIKRSKNCNIAKIITKESDALLSAVPKGNQIIALDVQGKQFSSEQFAKQLQEQQNNGMDLSLLVGGPDGLSDACLQCCRQRWSLSLMTLPHPLVRVMLAEQIYRAWSMLTKHPYHRG